MSEIYVYSSTNVRSGENVLITFEMLEKDLIAVWSFCTCMIVTNSFWDLGSFFTKKRMYQFDFDPISRTNICK